MSTLDTHRKRNGGCFQEGETPQAHEGQTSTPSPEVPLENAYLDTNLSNLSYTAGNDGIEVKEAYSKLSRWILGNHRD